MTPLSRGSVTINSTDPADLPVINPNFLNSTTDQELAIIGLKTARDLAIATGSTVGAELSPGQTVQNDSQILDFLTKNSVTMSHAACTCGSFDTVFPFRLAHLTAGSMGPASDPMAVVSSTGKVYGVQALRVVDASIFPFLPPGYPQGTICECFFLVFTKSIGFAN